MQKKIAFILFFISINVLAATPAATLLNIPQGEYELKKGDKGCDGGDLTYTDNDSVILGARALAVKITTPDWNETERDCKFTYSNKLVKGSLLQVTQDECKGSPKVKRKISVQKTEKGFHYSITLEDASGKVEKTISCTLALKK
jgi:hypothetical protein